MKSKSWYFLKIIKDTGAVGRSVLLIVEGYNRAIATYRVPFDANRATPPPPHPTGIRSHQPAAPPPPPSSFLGGEVRRGLPRPTLWRSSSIEDLYFRSTTHNVRCELVVGAGRPVWVRGAGGRTPPPSEKEEWRRRRSFICGTSAARLSASSYLL